MASPLLSPEIRDSLNTINAQDSTPPPPAKNHLTRNVSAEAEKPLFILITAVRVILAFETE